MSRVELIPAIDIIEGRCVRLSQGDYAQTKVYDASPVDMAKRYADCGVRRIHVVDLDGAKASAPKNLKTLEKIAVEMQTPKTAITTTMIIVESNQFGIPLVPFVERDFLAFEIFIFPIFGSPLYVYFI